MTRFVLLVALAGCGSVSIAPADGGDAQAPMDGGSRDVPAAGGAGGRARDGGAAGAAGAPAPVGGLIPNFAGWHYVAQPAGGGALEDRGAPPVIDGRLCVTVAAGESVYAGWPADPAPGVALAGGTPLRFSFTASATAPVAAFVPSVGHSSSKSFVQDFVAPASPAVGPADYRFVVPVAGDTSAGVDFQVSAGAEPATVCIGAVYLGP